MKALKILSIILTGLILSGSLNLRAQQNNAGNFSADEVYLFIEGENISNVYLRKELPFVTFVREPQLSNVHLLITSVNNAAGGELYRIDFMGTQGFSGKNFELRHTTKQYETEIEVREGLVKLIKMGLMPYVAQTHSKNSIIFAYDEEEKIQASSEIVEDPWNLWVFGIGGDLWYEEEESRKEYMLSSSIDFDRVNENWRIRNNIDYDLELKQFSDQDKIIQSINRESKINSIVVKSLSERWSAGIFASLESSNFTNLKQSIRITPALEYNIFSWEEVDRRRFTIAYFAGFRNNNYFEETIYSRISENLMYEELIINFQIIKPWGEVNSSLSGSHYFHNINFNNVEVETEISFRLTKFLFFNIEAGFKMINDQLYLPKGEPSIEDILLEQNKRATTYELEFRLGLDFRFGSIYNNVINKRL